MQVPRSSLQTPNGAHVVNSNVRWPINWFAALLLLVHPVRLVPLHIQVGVLSDVVDHQTSRTRACKGHERDEGDDLGLGLHIVIEVLFCKGLLKAIYIPEKHCESRWPFQSTLSE